MIYLGFALIQNRYLAFGGNSKWMKIEKAIQLRTAFSYLLIMKLILLRRYQQRLLNQLQAQLSLA